MNDAERSVAGLRARQLLAADGIVGRCQAMCERILAAQGDNPDASVVQLQHDCVQWGGFWNAAPVREQDCEAPAVEADGVIPLGHFLDESQNQEEN